MQPNPHRHLPSKDPPKEKGRRGRPSKAVIAQRKKESEQRRNRSRSRERNEREHSSSRSPRRNLPSEGNSANSPEQQIEMPARDASNQEFANAIRILFINFFDKVGHNKGFVFSNQERQKMIKEQERIQSQSTLQPQINWKYKSCWEEKTEAEKVDLLFSQSGTFLLSETVMEDVKRIFIEASFMFADEVTSQLYRIMLEVLRIARSEDQSESALRQLSNRMRKGRGYIFFGFKFSAYFQLNLQESRSSHIYEDMLTTLLCILKQKLN